MATIRKLPSGNYNAHVYNKYLKTTKSFTSPSKDEVKRMVAAYELNMEKKRLMDYTVGEAIDVYIETRSSVLSPSTRRSYHCYNRKHYGSIRNLSVDDITSEDLQRFVNDLSATHSPKTVRNVYGLLSSSLKAVRPNKPINVTLPQKRVYQRHIHSDEDVQKLLGMAGENLRKSILLAAFGTMREGEIAALKYKDIDGDVIHVHASFAQDEHYKWIYKECPKTSSSDRFIPFPHKIIEELGSGDPEAYVVPLRPNTIGKEYIKLRDKLDMPYRFHDLRHYAASIMHALGVPDQYIMKRGGWANDGVLKSVYRNVLDDKEKEFADITNSYAEKFLE